MNCYVFQRDKNEICNKCNIKLDTDKYKKDRTTCKDCYYRKKRKNNSNTLIQNQQPKNNNVKNNRTLLVGRSVSGKTYLVLKILSRIRDRHISITTKSTPEQYSISKNKFQQIGVEIKLLNEYENVIIAIVGTLGSSNSRYIDQFFIKGRHNILDIYYLSQSYFDLPKMTIRNYSNKIIPFNQTKKI